MKSGHPSKVINRWILALLFSESGKGLAYLNDVVTIVILDAVDDSAFEFSDKSIPLILQDMLESFLDHLASAS
jgi:hypothetical protein